MSRRWPDRGVICRPANPACAGGRIRGRQCDDPSQLNETPCLPSASPHSPALLLPFYASSCLFVAISPPAACGCAVGGLGSPGSGPTVLPSHHPIRGTP